MSQLKPKRIVLHCGLHKTGSTYIQRNLRRNQDLLLKQGVLFLGPNTFKKCCSELWRYLQWGETNNKTTESLQSQTRDSLLELAENHRQDIDNKLDKTPNPGLNERGLALALQAHPLFNDSEWKLFCKFPEKNFANTP